MSYIVEEPNETPIYYNEIKEEIKYNTGHEYSKLQKNRFKKVLNQLKSIWWDVYQQIKNIRDTNPYLTLEESNFFMNKIHKLFFIQLKSRLEFYAVEKIQKRKDKNYIKNKIKKLKNLKQKL